MRTSTLLCEHSNPRANCYNFACRAAMWVGPRGLSAQDLRYSIVYSIEAEWRWGKQYPPDVKGVKWRYVGRERCEDGWWEWNWAAAMDYPAFVEVLGDMEFSILSAGIMGPIELPDWMPPAVTFTDGENERCVVTAWPKDWPKDEHLYDAWDAIEGLLVGHIAAGFVQGGSVGE